MSTPRIDEVMGVASEFVENSMVAPASVARQVEIDLNDALEKINLLTAALRKANSQAEHFERLWYLAQADADRYAYAKTAEGQIVTMETFKNLGSAALDEALDDAMSDETLDND